MSDGLFARWWPDHSRLPRRPEPAEEQQLTELVPYRKEFDPGGLPDAGRPSYFPWKRSILEMRIKSAVILSALVATLGVGGVATASTAAPAKPKAYGVCVNAKNGSMRLLEPLNLRRSQFGKCKAGERRVFLPTKGAIPVVPPPPATVIYKRPGTIETCTKTTDATLTYECKTVPAPTPTPTATS